MASSGRSLCMFERAKPPMREGSWPPGLSYSENTNVSFSESTMLPGDTVAWLEHRLHLQRVALETQHKELLAELVDRCTTPILDEAAVDAAAAAFTVAFTEVAPSTAKGTLSKAADHHQADKWVQSHPVHPRTADIQLPNGKAGPGDSDSVISNEAKRHGEGGNKSLPKVTSVCSTDKDASDGDLQSVRKQESRVKQGAEDNERPRASVKVPVEVVRGRLMESMDLDNLDIDEKEGSKKKRWGSAPPDWDSAYLQRLQKFVHGIRFEVATNTVILANALLLALETQYDGVSSGSELLPHKYHEAWNGFGDAIEFMNSAFTVCFIVELLLRLAADGVQAAKQFWIWFDSVIVAFGVLELLKENPAIGFNPTLVRMARLARIMRVFRIVEAIQAFESLYLLVRSIQASVGALIWSFVFLVALQVAFGLCISQLLQSYWEDEGREIDKRIIIFQYFGTFSRTLVTMFEITIGNWAPSCRALMDNVTDWFGLFYILYACCFSFAIVRVITAVFITETQRVVSNDDQMAIRRKEKEKETYLARLRHMCKDLDKSGDGRVDQKEFADFIGEPIMKTWLATLDINSHDLNSLFKLLDNGQGEIELEEFITGLSRLKGPATSIDVVTVLKIVNNMNDKLRVLMTTVDKQPPHCSTPRASSNTRQAPASPGGSKGFDGVAAPLPVSS